MPELRFLTLIIFAAGALLLAVGLIGIPLSDILLVAGSAVASFAYSALFLSWRAAKAAPTAPGGIPTAPAIPTTPSTPGPSATPTAEAPQMPTESVTTPGSPTVPAMEQPKPPGGKLPSAKAPRIQLPAVVVENRVPIALLGIGLVLIVAAVAITFGNAAAFFWGIFIPGILLLGIGSGLLFLRLYRRPGPVIVELRRFCMHCGFQMSSGDVYCGRCHRQPPSGVDTKVCPNCGAVIPTLAKFCRDCGAGQPAS